MSYFFLEHMLRRKRFSCCVSVRLFPPHFFTTVKSYFCACMQLLIKFISVSHHVSKNKTKTSPAVHLSKESKMWKNLSDTSSGSDLEAEQLS